MSDLGWIIIPNWDDFQHYKDRDPNWIKLYLRLLDDDDYLSLTSEQRGVLHGTWMAYAKANGRLTADTRLLSRKLNVRVTKATLGRLADAGFIQLSASRPGAVRSKTASKIGALTRVDARSQEKRREETQRQDPTATPDSSIGIVSRDVSDRNTAAPPTIPDSEYAHDLQPLNFTPPKPRAA